MLNSSVLLKILYPQPLILPCLYFFLNSPFIISEVKQHILTWHSSWEVKMHTTIFNQKALLDMEWVHYSHLTWKMYYKMIILKWSGKFTLKVRMSEGYVKFFPSKKQTFFRDCNLSSINFTSAFPLHEKVGKKDQILKRLVVAILCPFKF